MKALQANHLRIGNWVGVNLEEYPENYFTMVEVADHCCILYDGIAKVSRYNKMQFECEDLEGIPLTQDWLKKLGGKESTDNYGGFLIEIGEGECIRIKYTIDEGWIWPMNGHKHPKVPFIHTLQNLIFALTGEELLIKD